MRYAYFSNAANIIIQNYWDLLPTEIFHHILSHLTFYQIHNR